mmetsp:Transcript_7261/g.30062  ORF Transcript_7261/g.30062 Transcript_7261/m.30062 type:complete len:260 (+) Transcript_7261:400-1179(+)
MNAVVHGEADEDDGGDGLAYAEVPAHYAVDADAHDGRDGARDRHGRQEAGSEVGGGDDQHDKGHHEAQEQTLNRVLHERLLRLHPRPRPVPGAERPVHARGSLGVDPVHDALPPLEHRPRRPRHRRVLERRIRGDAVVKHLGHGTVRVGSLEADVLAQKLAVLGRQKLVHLGRERLLRRRERAVQRRLILCEISHRADDPRGGAVPKERAALAPGRVARRRREIVARAREVRLRLGRARVERPREPKLAALRGFPPVHF